MSQTQTLSSNQRKALAALVASRSITQAAERCGLATRTLHRYLADPLFSSELARLEGDSIDAAVRWLIQELEASIAALLGIRDDEEASHMERRQAATATIDRMIKLRELRDIEQRLQRLEELAYGK